MAALKWIKKTEEFVLKTLRFCCFFRKKLSIAWCCHPFSWQLISWTGIPLPRRWALKRELLRSFESWEKRKKSWNHVKSMEIESLNSEQIVPCWCSFVFLGFSEIGRFVVKSWSTMLVQGLWQGLNPLLFMRKRWYRNILQATTVFRDWACQPQLPIILDKMHSQRVIIKLNPFLWNPI